jgi:hypothetical protein
MASGLEHGAMVTAVHLIVDAEESLLRRNRLLTGALTSNSGAVLHMPQLRGTERQSLVPERAVNSKFRLLWSVAMLSGCTGAARSF